MIQFLLLDFSFAVSQAYGSYYLQNLASQNLYKFICLIAYVRGLPILILLASLLFQSLNMGNVYYGGKLISTIMISIYIGPS